MLKEFLEDILDYLEDNFKYDLAMLVVFVFCICMAFVPYIFVAYAITMLIPKFI